MYYTFEDLLRARNEAESQRQSVNPAEIPHVWIPPEPSSQPISSPTISVFVIENYYSSIPSPSSAYTGMDFVPGKYIIETYERYQTVKDYLQGKGYLIIGDDLPTDTDWFNPSSGYSKYAVFQVDEDPSWPISDNNDMDKDGTYYDFWLYLYADIIDYHTPWESNLHIRNSGTPLGSRILNRAERSRLSTIEFEEIHLYLDTIINYGVTLGFGTSDDFISYGGYSRLIGTPPSSVYEPFPFISNWNSSIDFADEDYDAANHYSETDAMVAMQIYKKLPDYIIKRS